MALTTVKGSVQSYSVKSLGAAGDGVTDDSAAIQKGIDAVYLAGGGTLVFPVGVYRAASLKAKDNVRLLGESYGSVTFKLPDGVDDQIIENATAASATLDYFAVENIIFDGNQANAAKILDAKSAVNVSECTFFSARNCEFKNAVGYGLALQAYPAHATANRAQSQIYLENCRFSANGIGSDGAGGDGTGGAGDTFDGLDIKDCDEATIIGCTATNNYDSGFDIRGEKVSISNCLATLNGQDASAGTGAGFDIRGNHNVGDLDTTLTLMGVEARSNVGPGIKLSDGANTPTRTVRVVVDGFITSANEEGLWVQSLATSDLTGVVSNGISFENSDHGIEVSGVSPLHALTGVTISNVISRDNTGSGIYSNVNGIQVSNCQLNGNTRYGYEEGANATQSIISGATQILSNTIGQVLWNSGGWHMVGGGVRDFVMNSTDIVASAATLTLPEGGCYFDITGTADITSITASTRGRIIVLRFTGTAATNGFVDGNNIVLSATPFSYSPNDTLTFACSGPTYYEISRSVNAA